MFAAGWRWIDNHKTCTYRGHGQALAAQIQGRENVALAYFGEGAVNQGVFHETLNRAAVGKLPVILLCENNLYSEMTPIHETSSVGEMTRRGQAYGLPSVRIDGNDVDSVYTAVEQAASRARDGGGPPFIEAMRYRLWGHMMGDRASYRTKQEVVEVADIVASALSFAEASPTPDRADVAQGVFA